MKKEQFSRSSQAAAMAAFSISLMLTLSVAVGTDKPAFAEGSVTQYSDGVSVRKNSDGTVEVSDDGYVDFAPAPPSPVHSTRRGGGHVKTGVTRYSDGVTVKRCADGSVEVNDTSRPVHNSVVHSARQVKSKRPVRTATRYRDGVTVRKNSDGSVEVWDTATASR